MSKATINNLKANLVNAVGYANILSIFDTEAAWANYLSDNNLQIDTRIWTPYPNAIKAMLSVSDLSEFDFVGPVPSGPITSQKVKDMITSNLCPREVFIMLAEINIDRDLANTIACNRDGARFWRLISDHRINAGHNIFMSHNLLKNIIVLNGLLSNNH